MSIADAFRLVADNLNTTPEILVMMVAFLGGLVFYAEDFRIGVILHFLIYTTVFVWFYAKNMMWAYPLIAALMSGVVLTFTLMAAQKSADKGVII